MKFLMKKLLRHKKIIGILAVGVFILGGAPGVVHAQVDTIANIISGAAANLSTSTLSKATDAVSTGLSFLNPLTWVILGLNAISTFLSFAISAFISFAGLLLNIVLTLSSTLAQSPLVLTGFSICLAIMNLGLVVAALFMAVATIAEPVLGNDTFAIKKRLPTLILVAVFANFLLLGAGTVLKFADGASFYLASQASPGSGGAAAYMDFAMKLAGAFQPQVLLNVGDMKNGVSNGLSSLAFSTQGFGVGQTFQALLNIIFILGFELFIFLVMLIAAVMFLVRYIYLGILFIIAPLALLSSLFPSLASHWKGWCTKFLHWTMFGPLMMLGLYLAILASQQRGKFLDTPISGVTNDQNSASSALLQQAGRQPGFWQSLAEMLMILGIAGGGIVMASSLSPKFAQSTMTGAQNLGKRGKDYLVKRGRQGVGGALNTPERQARYSEMQRSGNLLTRWRGRLGQNVLIGSSRAGEKDAEAWVAARTNKQLIDNYSTMNEAQKIAALEKMRKEGMLNQLPTDVLDKDLTNMKAAFERRGALSTFDAIRKESGSALLNSAGGDEELKKAASGVSMANLAATAFLNRAKAEEEGNKVGMSRTEQEDIQKKLVKSLLLLGDPNKLAAAAQAASNAGQLDTFKNVLRGVTAELAERAKNGEKNMDRYHKDEILRYLKGNAAQTLGLGPDDIQPLTAALTPKTSPSTPQPDYDIVVDDFGERRVPKAAGGSSGNTATPPQPTPPQPQKPGGSSRRTQAAPQTEPEYAEAIAA